MKALAILLCASLIWQTLPVDRAFAAVEESPSEAEILKRYPHARVYRVTESEFQRIRPLLAERVAHETIILAQADVASDGVLAESHTNRTDAVTTNTSSSVTNRVAAPVDDGFIAIPPSIEQGAGSPRHVDPLIDDRTCTGAFDLIGDLGSLDSDAAIVIFIIIGVCVVAAVILYSGALLYQAATGVGDCSYWWDTNVHTATLAGGGDSGGIAALRIGSGVDLLEARLGLVLEGGYIDAEITLDEAPDQLDVEGGFVMGGAGVRWPLGSSASNASFFGMELLAGKIWDVDVDLMSVARATLSLGLREHLRLGFSLGALYLGLDAEDALVEHIDNFTTLVGVEAGVRF